MRGQALELTLPFNKVERLPTDKSLVLECRDNLAFMRSLPDGSMKLIVTSPPYNIGKAYERRSSLEQYIQRQTAVIAECVRLLHPRGSICWQVGNHVNKGEIVPLDIPLFPVFKNHGLKLRNRIVWHFEHGLHCSKRLSGRYETINWFTKGDGICSAPVQPTCPGGMLARPLQETKGEALFLQL